MKETVINELEPDPLYDFLRIGTITQDPIELKERMWNRIY